MGQGIGLTSSSKKPADLSDARSISAELQLQLPGELVEIVGKRLRVEAAIAQLDTGDVLCHLRVSALTPGDKTIVRYELEAPPSRALASNLAALISRAKDKNLPGETVIQSIREYLHPGSTLHFKKIEPERNPFVTPPMERTIPEFEEFAQNPEVMDTAFSVERDIPGARVKATATLFPHNRYTVIEASTFPNNGTQTPTVERFKVRCPDSFWDRPRTTAEVIAALHVATWEAMDTLSTQGATKARRACLNPELDERLMRGMVNAPTCNTIATLPSGARVLLEEGDRIACVRIESSDDEPATAMFWRICGQEGILLANDPKLITTRSAVEALVEGDLNQRLKAISKLDRLEQAFPIPTPRGTSPVYPFETPSLEQIVGFETSEMLSRLRGTKTEVMPPNSQPLILDLLQGIHSIQLSPENSTHSDHSPQDPKHLFFGFRSDGALKVTIMSPLQNYLETLIPATYFEDSVRREDVVERLAMLYDRQTSEALLELRQEIEILSLQSDGERCDSTNLRPPAQRFPSVENGALAEALGVAADIALIYKTDAKGFISDIHLNFIDPHRCEVVVGGDDMEPHEFTMHLHTSEFGVHAIDLNYSERNEKYRRRFTLESPITIVEGRTVLATIFKHLQDLKVARMVTTLDAEQPLTNTSLFRYLQECEERFAES